MCGNFTPLFQSSPIYITITKTTYKAQTLAHNTIIIIPYFSNVYSCQYKPDKDRQRIKNLV